MGSDGIRRHRAKEDRRRESGGDKLTEEERRLYDKARAFVEQDDKGRRSRSGRHRSDSSEEDDHRRKGRKKKSRDEYNSSDDDDGKRHHRSSSHRDRKKHHKRSSRERDDRHHEKSRQKKSKHRHHNDEEKHDKHRSKRHKHHDDSFRQKATKHRSKLVSLGEVASEPPQELLHTDTNYFSHNSHLRLYLFRRYGIYFEDLNSEESHDAFKEFVSKYNDGKLETAYYDAKGKLPQDALDQCQRTQHKWNFKTNKVEEQSLKMVRDGVKKQTEYDADNNDNGGMMQQRALLATTAVTAAAMRPKPADRSDESNNKLSYDERRRLDKQHRERIIVGNEEIYGTGKADHGRDRMIEKKREQSNKIHGAARDRESEAGLELDDKVIYGGEGGGDISYEAALEREKKYRERREAAKHERTSELLKKEEEKQKKMFEMLGLKPGEKIKIVPRQA